MKDANTKQHIIDEIRRTATDGKPLGEATFRTATGIARKDWMGKYWARFGDAQRAAGFTPNQMTAALRDEDTLPHLALLVRKLKKLPTSSEIRLERRENPALPRGEQLTRGGSYADLGVRLRKFCLQHSEFGDVAALLAELGSDAPAAKVADDLAGGSAGYVYLVSDPDKRQLRYKIGSCDDIPSRMRQLKTSSPNLEMKASHRVEHAEAVEKYWQTRLAARNHKAEWFDLTADDVRTFKEWKGIVPLKSRR